MTKVFRFTETAQCYRYAYIEAETEEEAIKKWDSADDYISVDDWEELELDDVKFEAIKEIEAF